MCQVLLFSDCSNSGATFANAKPFGMYRLASTLREKGYTAQTINYFSSLTDEQFDRIIEKYITNETVLVCVSASVLADIPQGHFFGIETPRLTEIFRKIKEKNNKIKFAAGGGQINNCSEQMKKTFTMFDFLCVGQGEEIILGLVKHAIDNTPITKSTLDKPYVVTDTFYPYKDFSNSGISFHNSDYILANECLPIEVARGCIFKCKFCSYDLTNKKLNDFTREEEKIREELIFNYQNFKTQYYYIADDLLNDSVEKLDMLERVISSLDFKIYFGAYIRLDMIWRHPETIHTLKRIGLISAFLGIETINDKSGSSVGKGLGLNRINETLKKIHEVWQNTIYLEAGFILGLPHDTTNTAGELLEWAKETISNRYLTAIHLKALNITPWLDKSDIAKNPEKFGYTLSYSEADKLQVRPNVAWTSNDYSKELANIDVRKIYQELNNLQWYMLCAFNIPNILSLLKEEEKQMYFDFLENPTTLDRVYFKELLESRIAQQKKEYLELLLQ